MKKNTFKVLSASGLALSLLLSSGTSISAASPLPKEHAPTTQLQNNLTKEEVAYLKDFLTEYGVEEPVQKKLIAKLRAGKIWDSLTGSSEIVSSKTVEKGEEIETVDKYTDGSVKVTSVTPTKVEEGTVEADGDIIAPFAIKPGTVNSGTGYTTYTGATVYMQTGVANADYKTNFTILKGGNDYISSVYGYQVKTFGGTFSGANNRIVKAREDLNSGAKSELTFTYTLVGGTASSLVRLQFILANDRYTSFSN